MHSLAKASCYLLCCGHGLGVVTSEQEAEVAMAAEQLQRRCKGEEREPLRASPLQAHKTAKQKHDSTTPA